MFMGLLETFMRKVPEAYLEKQTLTGSLLSPSHLPLLTHFIDPLCLAEVRHTVVQSLSRVQIFVTPWTAAHQASLSFTISPSLLKLVFTELMRPSNHLTLCHPLLLLPSIFPSIRVFPKGSSHQRVSNTN